MSINPIINTHLPKTAGHFPFGIDKKFQNNKKYLITCLREPIERVISFYIYQKRMNNTDTDFINFESQNGIVKRFCGYYYDKQKSKVCNYITKEEDIDPNFEITKKDLDTAINNLNSFSLIMFQENFIESLVLLENIIDKRPLFSIHHQFTNSFKNQNNWSDTYDKKELSKIISNNQYDIQLYKYFKNKFNKLLGSQNSSFTKRVEKFNLINSILTPANGHNILSHNDFISRFNGLTKQLVNQKEFHLLNDILSIALEKYPENEEFTRVQKLTIDMINQNHNLKEKNES